MKHINSLHSLLINPTSIAKTSKTLCGRRVKTENISVAQAAECPPCLREDIDFWEHVENYLRKTGVDQADLGDMQMRIGALQHRLEVVLR